MTSFREQVLDVVRRATENNLWRQRDCINLIPSETTPSLLVKLCEISDPAGRYAEHRTMKGREVYFYQGTGFIRDVELEVQEALRRYFGCAQIEVRPISGQMANEVVFKAAVRFVNRREKGWRRLRAVMNNELARGGHLSSQPMGALFNFVEIDPDTGKERVINFPVLEENPYRIDESRLPELIEAHRPELIVFGKSMFIHPEPVALAAEVAARLEPRPIIMYDMAHVLGLYGAFQAPLDEGADVVTGSTHKTFFGPQRGVIASNMVKGSPFGRMWLDVKSRAFPGSTSNHHLGTLLALLVAAHEMNAFKDEYQTQVLRNARAFARACLDQGLHVEGDPERGYTETHQVLLRVREHGPGEEIAARLERNNIIVNYQALPDDASFLESSGIRMGVQEMTRFGMRESDFETLAGLLAEVIIRDAEVKEEVAAFRAGFREMRFCLPADEALEAGAGLLATMLPGSDYVQRFAENLGKAAALL
jgi:glycine/serine hydroxymethyltransferase